MARVINTREDGLLCVIIIPEILAQQDVMAKSSSTKSYLVCWSVSWFVWSLYPMLSLLKTISECKNCSVKSPVNKIFIIVKAKIHGWTDRSKAIIFDYCSNSAPALSHFSISTRLRTLSRWNIYFYASPTLYNTKYSSLVSCWLIFLEFLGACERYNFCKKIREHYCSEISSQFS